MFAHGLVPLVESLRRNVGGHPLHPAPTMLNPLWNNHEYEKICIKTHFAFQKLSVEEQMKFWESRRTSPSLRLQSSWGAH